MKLMAKIDETTFMSVKRDIGETTFAEDIGYEELPADSKIDYEHELQF
jgi:hypothetical protein